MGDEGGRIRAFHNVCRHRGTLLCKQDEGQLAGRIQCHVCEWHFHPDQIARPGFDPSDAVEFWHLTNRQDWELSDMAQEGIASRGYEPGPYSNREELLHALDRFVIDRVDGPRS